jgi:O-antigen ligase
MCEMLDPPYPTTGLHGPDAVRSAAAAPPAAALPAVAEQSAGRSTVLILLGLAGVWCAAMCGHVDPELATAGLAAAYALLFLLLLPFNRWASFLVLVAMCAAEKVLQGWSPMPFNGVLYAVMLLLPVAFLCSPGRTQLPKPLIFWLGVCFWAALSVLWCEVLIPWRDRTVDYLGVAGLAMLTRHLATSPRRRQEMGIVFAVTSIAIVVALLVAVGFGKEGRLGDASGLNANEIGGLLASGMLLYSMAIADGRRQGLRSPVHLLTLGALGVGLLLTQSRGCMVAVAGAALTIAVGQRRFQHRLAALSLFGLLGAMLVLAAVRLNPSGMQQRWVDTFGEGSLVHHTSGRSEIFRTGGYMLRENWIAGVGAGQFFVAYSEYSTLAQSTDHRGKNRAAHSAYLSLSTEGGLVTIVLMVGFFFSLWLAASRLSAGQRRAVARGVVVFLLLILFTTDQMQKPHWLALGLLFVWCWESSRDRARHAGVPNGTRSGANHPTLGPSQPVS